MDRLSLEQPHSPAEMERVIREHYGQASRQHLTSRRGLAKDMAEEYVPLWQMVRRWPGIKAVRLTPKSHPGPDAWLTQASGKEMSVQVTLAGASEQDYFNRLAAEAGRAYFPEQWKTFDRREHRLSSSGRALRAPKGIVQHCAHAVVAAAEHKGCKAANADVLLVVYERGLAPRRLLTAAKRAIDKQIAESFSRAVFKSIFVNLGCSTYRLRVR